MNMKLTKKHLALGTIILVIIILFITFFPYRFSINHWYKIKSCEIGSDNRDEIINLQVDGDALNFNIKKIVNCVANRHNLKLDYIKTENQIDIMIIEKRSLLSGYPGLIAGCSCPYEIIGKIRNLDKGNYKIDIIYEDRIDKNPPVLMESKEIQIQ